VLDEILRLAIRDWVDDAESAVEYAEYVEGRWAVRVRQEVRDFTTIWWSAGQRSIWAEAFVWPPPRRPAESYRMCLTWNRRCWRVHFALDEDGALVLRGRTTDPEELEMILAEMYEMVEVTFNALARENSA